MKAMREVDYCFESSAYFRCPGADRGHYLVLSCGHCRWEPGREVPESVPCNECDPATGPDCQ